MRTAIAHGPESRMKLAYLTNGLPHYRADFIQRLLTSKEVDATVFCQSEAGKGQLDKIGVSWGARIVMCRTFRLFGSAVTFETLPFRSLLMDYDVIVSDGNPRHLGFAIASTLAVLFRRRVVIWSTLHSRRNRELTQKMRLAWWRLFKEFFSYTERDAENLRAQMVGKLVWSTNNGLDQDAIARGRQRYDHEYRKAQRKDLCLGNSSVILSAGRALPGRFDLMVGVLKLLRSRSVAVKWILLGDGPGLGDLRRKLESAELSDAVIFAGAVHEVDETAKWFGVADLFVYPEAIGLSLYHAFGFGLPVVIHNHATTQGPEVSIFEEGRTGLTFEKGSAVDMANKITDLLHRPEIRRSMGKAGLELVETRYNSRIMYERFIAGLLADGDSYRAP